MMQQHKCLASKNMDSSACDIQDAILGDPPLSEGVKFACGFVMLVALTIELPHSCIMHVLVGRQIDFAVWSSNMTAS